MQLLFLLLSVLCVSFTVAIYERDTENMPWMNVRDTPAQRAQKLLQQMTFSEKLDMVHGSPTGPYQGNTPANQRLGIPPLRFEDGPQGPGSDGIRLSTCWPAPLAVVASFDVQLMENCSAAIAKEERDKGVSIMLGPMVNIARIPQGGRNFESFGEDPFLAGEMAAASVKGIQSTGIMACVKHWANNNQEHDRGQVSANVDERTEHEIYYPAFKKAVEAGVGSVMCGYNKVNNTYACENYQTLTVDLKKEMGFQGFVVSDWGGTHSTVASANNGLDLQMPDGTYFGNALQQAVQSGQVSMSRFDDMLLRILTPVFAVGIFDNPPTGDIHTNVTSDEHNKLARQLAEAGTVLLKNYNNTLPLDANIKKIAIIGDDGQNKPIVAPPNVVPPYVITPLQGIKQRAGSSASINYVPSGQLQNAVAAAKAADVAIVFVAIISNEGEDRSTLSLGTDQDSLVKAIAAVQPNTIVVVHSTGAVLMPWVSSVASILAAFLPGQEDGNAIAAVLFGDVNPSGKLPITFPAADNQVPANTPQQYPGVNEETQYSEQLLVGYRWYDAKNMEPLFPFGHGLSYTTFRYGNLSINGLNIIGTVANIGNVAGAEVVQLYLSFPASAGEPPQVLRGFQKLFINSGEIKSFSFTLTQDDLSIWDISKPGWVVISGSFTVLIGSSSRDIHLKGYITN